MGRSVSCSSSRESDCSPGGFERSESVDRLKRGSEGVAAAILSLVRHFLLAGLFRRMVRDGESAALVVTVFFVILVESLEECFLLVLIVLGRLCLGQIRNVSVGHDPISLYSVDPLGDSAVLAVANSFPPSVDGLHRLIARVALYEFRSSSTLVARYGVGAADSYCSVSLSRTI